MAVPDGLLSRAKVRMMVDRLSSAEIRATTESADRVTKALSAGKSNPASVGGMSSPNWVPTVKSVVPVRTPLVAVIVTVPASSALTSPLALTDATVGSEDVQVKAAACATPAPLCETAASWRVPPTETEGCCGVMVTYPASSGTGVETRRENSNVCTVGGTRNCQNFGAEVAPGRRIPS